MAIREGRWDCATCGSTRIYGRHVDCPGCGTPRPAGTRFYLTDDAPVITDAAQLAEARAGADWVCMHCAASNRATVDPCAGCGAPRGSSPSQPVIDYAFANVPRPADAPPPSSASDQTPIDGPADPPSAEPHAAPFEQAATMLDPDRPADAPPPPSEPLTAKDAALGCAWGCWPLWAGVLALLFGVLNNWNDDRVMRVQVATVDPGTVVNVRWERSIGLEERTIVEGEGFSLPDSAEVLSQRRAIERYDEQLEGYRTDSRQVRRGSRTETGSRTRTREVSEQVQVGTRRSVCGQRDLGNGYFEDVTCNEPVYETRTRTETYEEPVTRTEPDYETVEERTPIYRSVPVYGTLYRWRGPQWKPLPAVVAEGSAAPAVWPQVTPAPGQRLGARRERYVVVVSSLRRVEEIEITADQLAWYRAGQLVGVGRREDGYTWRLAPADSVTECVEWRAGRRDRPSPAQYQCEQRLPFAAPRPPAPR